MYKAIFFDLGKVLVHFDFDRGYRALESLCPYPSAEIPQRLMANGVVERFETGLIEPEDFVSQLVASLGLQLDYEGFCRVWSCIFTGPLVPENMVESLAARYKLVLLSNTNAIHFAMLRETYPVLRHFHDLVLSYEVKAMKPSPTIYQAALDRAGCAPGECFYTDDIADYVEAARRMGIDAVQFESVEQLEAAMRSRGIEW
jgi:FMN phosphatase YigB (HAD superfamily)